ncbi:MAG TPA: hypothetical protein VN901_16715 [Candidatus Acidoferrales bacterium]|nr:hypothetical protein [Candidatus Acidoferrales bacterium]
MNYTISRCAELSGALVDVVRTIIFSLMTPKNPQVCDNIHAGIRHPVTTNTGAPAI